MERPTGTVRRDKTTKVKNRCMKPPRRVSPLPAVDELLERISDRYTPEPLSFPWLFRQEEPSLAPRTPRTPTRCATELCVVDILSVEGTGSRGNRAGLR